MHIYFSYMSSDILVFCYSSLPSFTHRTYPLDALHQLWIVTFFFLNRFQAICKTWRVWTLLLFVRPQRIFLFWKELEKPPPDKLRGLRFHCWVLVLSGKREIPESFFIESTTGESYPLNFSGYLGVESVWNNGNCWVNMQDCTKGVMVRVEFMGKGKGLYCFSELKFVGMLRIVFREVSTVLKLTTENIWGSYYVRGGGLQIRKSIVCLQNCHFNPVSCIIGIAVLWILDVSTE